MNYSAAGAAGMYRQMAAQTGVVNASPHRLIQMLMDGALERIACAKGCMMRGEIAQKGDYINGAISIINGLRDSLNKDAGGGIAQNLDDLYEYMGYRLTRAHASNDVAGLDEVAGLLREIKAAWDAIPQNIR